MSKWNAEDLAWLASADGQDATEHMRDTTAVEDSTVARKTIDDRERGTDRVDADGVREQLLHWYERGYSMQQLGKAIGYSARSLADVRQGKRLRIRKVLTERVDHVVMVGLPSLVGEPVGKKFRARQGVWK